MSHRSVSAAAADDDDFAVRGVFFISMITVFVSMVPLPYSAMNLFDTTRDKSMNSWRCRCRCPSLILRSRPKYLPSCSVFVAVMVLFVGAILVSAPPKSLHDPRGFSSLGFLQCTKEPLLLG